MPTRFLVPCARAVLQAQLKMFQTFVQALGEDFFQFASRFMVVVITDLTVDGVNAVQHFLAFERRQHRFDIP